MQGSRVDHKRLVIETTQKVINLAREGSHHQIVRGNINITGKSIK
jgi:hypothetical protein